MSTDDLIERLRTFDGFETFTASDGYPAFRADTALMREAADALAEERRASEILAAGARAAEHERDRARADVERAYKRGWRDAMVGGRAVSTDDRQRQWHMVEATDGGKWIRLEVLEQAEAEFDTALAERTAERDEARQWAESMKATSGRPQPDLPWKVEQ